MTNHQDACLFCHRCGATLTPGRGDFYVVVITAIADPSPPVFTEEDLAGDLEAEIQATLDAIRGMSERELAEQVYRRLVIHLCGRCYSQWIENPTG